MPPLSLSDYQLSLIPEAARTLPLSGRDEFLRGVASHLGHEPSDRAVKAAVDAQLQVNRLPVFLCDSAAKGVAK
jgi:hypothetical protein